MGHASPRLGCRRGQPATVIGAGQNQVEPAAPTPEGGAPLLKSNPMQLIRFGGQFVQRQTFPSAFVQVESWAHAVPCKSAGQVPKSGKGPHTTASGCFICQLCEEQVPSVRHVSPRTSSPHSQTMPSWEHPLPLAGAEAGQGVGAFLPPQPRTNIHVSTVRRQSLMNLKTPRARISPTGHHHLREICMTRATITLSACQLRSTSGARDYLHAR